MTTFTDFAPLPKERPFETLTQFNGGHPFYIKIEDGVLTISKNLKHNDTEWYTNVENSEDYKYYDTVVMTTKIEKYWPGFDSVEGEHGNTFLAKIGDHKYIYAGNLVYTFVTPDEIVYFAAGMGNNTVPYTVAYGTEYLYLFEESGVIEKQKIPHINRYINPKHYFTNPWHSQRLWDLYYGHLRDLDGETVECPSKEMENVEEVHGGIV